MKYIVQLVEACSFVARSSWKDFDAARQGHFCDGGRDRSCAVCRSAGQQAARRKVRVVWARIWTRRRVAETAGEKMRGLGMADPSLPRTRSQFWCARSVGKEAGRFPTEEVCPLASVKVKGYERKVAKILFARAGLVLGRERRRRQTRELGSHKLISRVPRDPHRGPASGMHPCKLYLTRAVHATSSRCGCREQPDSPT